MAQEMTLIWASGSPPCWRVQIALKEKNLEDYNSKLISMDKGEHKSKEVTDINPRGQVPAFKIGDLVLNESIGACLYLEDQYKTQGNKLIPDCYKEKTVMYQRMFESLSLMQKMVDFAFYNWKVPENERHDSALQRNAESLTAEMKLWEGYLQQTEGCYLAGKSFSLADVVTFPVIAFLFRLGLCQKRYPKLAQYYNCVKQRPSINNTWPPTWLKDPQGQATLKDI